MDRANGSLTTSRPTPHGLLTPDNCVLALVDYQPMLFFVSDNADRQSIQNNVVGLAKAARVFEVPVVLAAIESAAFSGNTLPQLLAALGNPTPIERSTMNAWDTPEFVAAIERTGRKKVVLGGLWTEACVTFPTISMIEAGYEVYIPTDICGDLNRVAGCGAEFCKAERIGGRENKEGQRWRGGSGWRGSSSGGPGMRSRCGAGCRTGERRIRRRR